MRGDDGDQNKPLVPEIFILNPKVMDLKELKAQAYDCLANAELWQNRLKQVNEAISQEMNKKEEPVESAIEEVVEPKKK